jgi:hypothetical protein
VLLRMHLGWHVRAPSTHPKATRVLCDLAAVNHATQVGGAPAHSVHVLPVFTGYCILFQEHTATHTACKQTLKAAHSGWLDTCNMAVVPSCITMTWTHVYDTKAPGLHTPGLGACTANSTPGC